jgi:hypothetical protein
MWVRMKWTGVCSLLTFIASTLAFFGQLCDIACKKIIDAVKPVEENRNQWVGR